MAKAFVRLRGEEPGDLGIVQGVHQGDGELLQVRWIKSQRVSSHHRSLLTSGYEPGMEVAHQGSHQGMESLGHGKILASRHIGGDTQHLVEFWHRAESRWLPWTRLAPVRGVDSAFSALPQRPGDAEALRLKNLAYALSEWNASTGGLSRLEIDPLPHQIYVVNKILSSGDLNWMIADDVGLGKTIEVGLLLAALRERRLKRFLLVVPAGLTRQWQEELRDKFSLDDFVIYGEDAFPTNASQWRLYDRVIVSMDRAKHENHLGNILQAEEWDLVVVDEAHRLSRHEYGPSHETTERYAMAEALRSRTNAMLLLTGTPHQGRDDLFRGLLELLRPGPAWRDRFVRLRQHPEILTNLIIRNRKADVTDQDGNFIFRGKTSNTIEVHRTEAEQEFEKDLIEYFRAGYRAGAAAGRQGIAIGFVMTTYRKLAASSTAAIARALSRRAEKLRLGMDGLDTPDSEGVGAEPDARFVEHDEEVIGQAREFFEGELEAVTALADKAAALAPTDTKVSEFFEKVLPSLLEDDPKRKVLVFTEYRTTQDVLVDGLRARFGDRAVALIRGGQPMAERREVVDRFNEDLQFLVSTEAGGEGLNLQRRCNVLVNFDLPWNPMRLVQRVGRLYRYGQKERVVVFNMKTARTLDQDILSGMYARLDNVAADLAAVTGENREGLIEDILGQLIGALDVRDILEQAMETEEARSEERIAEAIERAKKAAKAQDKLLEFAAGFDPESIESRIEITTQHLKSFTESMFSAVGITIAQQVHDADVWDIRLPEKWQKSLGKKQNVRIAFDRAKARRYGGELFDADHPLLKALLEIARSDHRGAAAVIEGEGLSVGYTALVRWLDESGRPVDTRYLALTKGADGRWYENDSRWSEWLLRSARNGTGARAPSPEDRAAIARLLSDYAKREGPKRSIPDAHFPISGFVS